MIDERPWIKEARLYEELSEGRVECGTCERKCVISQEKLGFCKTRKNIGGKLYTLVYGNISSISVNPIEKKPFYHYWPGHSFLTAGTYSCTFTCGWCQNWEISKRAPNPDNANYISPEKFVKIASSEGCKGVSLSFNEPTLLFEYALDLFPLARKRGMAANYVTNGYMTFEALRMLRDAGLDAINIDVKGDGEAVKKYCGADVELVWRNVRESKRLGLHVEVVNLVIPGVNDLNEQIRELARRHLQEAGRDTPIHFTAYYPAHKFDAPPTPVSTLERAHDIAMSEGLEFVYIGNVPGHRYENTYCPSCGRLLIKRYGLELVETNLDDGKCPSCGCEIPIVGGPKKRRG